MFMRRLLPLLLLTALVIAACGDDTVAGDGDGGDGDGGDGGEVVTEPVAFGDGDEVWLEVETAGGYVPEIVFLRATPSLVLFDDGTLVRRTAEESPFEGLVPRFEVVTLDEDAAAGLLADFAAVVDGPDPGEPPVTDLPSTTIEVTTGGDTRELSIYALGVEDGLDDDERAARQAAQEAIDDATGLDPAEPFVPEEWLVLSSWTGIEPASDVAWPLERARLASARTPEVCTRITGGEVDAVLSALEDADPIEEIALQPVLTGDETCDLPEHDDFVER